MLSAFYAWTDVTGIPRTFKVQLLYSLAGQIFSERSTCLIKENHCILVNRHNAVFRKCKYYFLCFQAASPLNKSQIISRRLKLDLRNECDAAIAGIRNWNRPNSAATGQSVTLYERHPYTAEHAGM